MNTERLLKLAEHLESGKLAHEKFDFRFMNRSPVEVPESVDCLGIKFMAPEIRTECGTNGCAIGEFPAIWSDRFIWDSDGILDRTNGAESFDAAAGFLNISDEECEFLFVPRGHTLDFDHESMLTSIATKEQVAKHIREFVKHGGIYE